MKSFYRSRLQYSLGMHANIRSEITPFAGARYIVGHKQARACNELMLNFHVDL